MSIFKIPRTTRPDQTTKIDYSNPITRALLAYTVYCNNGFIDYTHDIKFLNVGRYGNFITTKQSKYGPVPWHSGNIEPVYDRPLTTMSGKYYPYTSYSYEALSFFCIFVIKDTSVVTTSNITVMGGNAPGWFGCSMWWSNAAGERQLTTNYGYNNPNISLSVTGISEGLHCAAMTGRLGEPCRLYLDGQLAATSGTALDSIYPYVQFAHYPCSTLNNLTVTNIGHYIGVGAFKLTDDTTLKSFTANPWQIFKPIDVNPQFITNARSRIVVPANFLTQRKSMMMGSSVVEDGSNLIKMPKVVRTTQPQGAAEIDWSNPITRSLAISATPSLPKLASAPKIANATGVGISYASTGNAGVALSTPSKVRSLFSQNIGTTVLVLADPKSTSTGTIPTGVLGGGIEWYVQFNLSITNPVQAGTFGFSCSGASHGADAAGVLDGETHAFIATIADAYAGIPVLYVDGVNKTTFGGTSRGFATGSADYIGGYATSGYAVSNYSLYLVVWWNRVLSDAEIKSISNNPWQIFKPDQRIIGVSA